jgi:MoaA/NifB/PqqE/SkfB family radical SAM enzyme
MKAQKRLDYLLRSPRLLYSILLRGHYDFQYDMMDVHSRQMALTKRLNLIKAGMNLINRKLNPWSWPLYMQIELTNYCNLKCKVCATGRGILGRKPASIEPALFKRILDEVGPYLLTLSLFSWGEPLLHPQLAEILPMIQNRGITTFISTNGQNLDDPKVQKALIDYPPTYLIVALDGLTDQTNSEFRVGARLEPALNGVRTLAKMKRERNQQFPILHHSFIVMKHNEHEVPQLRQFAEDNQFDMLTVRTLSNIDTEDQATFNEMVPTNPDYQPYEYQNGERLVRKDFICERAVVHPSVLVDGTVVPCCQCYSGKVAYGSVADGLSFADVWCGKKAVSLRKEIINNPDNISFCRNCTFKDRPVTDCHILRFIFKQGNK